MTGTIPNFLVLSKRQTNPKLPREEKKWLLQLLLEVFYNKKVNIIMELKRNSSYTRRRRKEISLQSQEKNGERECLTSPQETTILINKANL